MGSQPRLSIGIPVYNGERFLEQLLNNLRSQSFEDFEIIISDNASVDRTQLIALDLARADSRIKYYRNERNLGANPNFNRVAQLATAPLFKWTAHDDLYEPTYLEKCIRVLDENPDVVIAHSDCVCVDDDGTPFEEIAPRTFVDRSSGYLLKYDAIDLAESKWVLKRFWDVLFPMYCNLQIFGVMRREALMRTGLQRDYYGTDKLILAEMALLGRFVQLREKLFIKRYHKEMSWVLTAQEQQKWSLTSGAHRSRRLQQLRTFTAAVFGKDLSPIDLLACLGMIGLLVPKVLLMSILGEERKRIAMIAPRRT
jgi:glycosyltransferase involved in cell wall biosynthesis